ncbi:MAG: hypothetical protein C4555_01465 [Dehalococcoidia bacterium]|nr:MAG: hypothetical protein C4555_01465 [Dehalococcoidia bacterium]
MPLLGETVSASPRFEYLFHPRSIAVVGVSTDFSRVGPGRMYVEALLGSGFKGKIYPVGRSGGQVFDLRVYPALKDIPGSVDYVISAIPASETPRLVKDCAAKGVKTVHMFTAGFGEIAAKNGKKLEDEVASLARRSGIRLIGPNCMGIFCPDTGLSFELSLPRRSGSIGFVSQSGGNAIQAVREAQTKNLYFSKIISYGNAADLDECDFLDYLTDDPGTKIITAYIEGFEDGERFKNVIRRAARAKPLVVYKGGTSAGGRRAASSHTGAIAGSEIVWESFLKQVGAVQVYSLDEVLDMAVLFNYLTPPKGKAVGIIGIGGGNSVLAADACAREGLTAPLLPSAIRRRLEAIYSSEAGGSFRNPVDMYFAKFNLAHETVRAVADSPGIDLIIVHMTIGWSPKNDVDLAKKHVELLTGICGEVKKPVVVALRPFGPAKYTDATADAEAALFEAGFPVFFSVASAARAINRYVDYYQRRKRSR